MILWRIEMETIAKMYGDVKKHVDKLEDYVMNRFNKVEGEIEGLANDIGKMRNALDECLEILQKL